jgi:hypothetical protein
MLRAVARGAFRSLNAALRPAGVQIVRSRPREYEDYKDFIPFEKTIAAAREKGVSVGDYVDAEHNQAGATQQHFDRLREMGAVHAGIRRVCEIGPGSGRYLERVIGACHPERYEIYETAEDWKSYLVGAYSVVAQPTDGTSLAATASGSIDLVHAHKVFPGVPFLVTCRYLNEMARVAAPGGKVVFDIVTERCMDEATVERWLETGAGYQYYPNMMPRQYVVDLFARLGFATDGSVMVPMRPGVTECMVFTRT